MNAADLSLTHVPSSLSRLLSLHSVIAKFLKKQLSILLDLGTTDYSRPAGINRLKTVRRIFKNPFFLPFGIVVFVVLLVGFFAVRNLGKNSSSSTAAKIRIQDAKASQVLNKQFTFPLKDASGKEVSRLQFVLENVEIKDEIIVKGKRATSVVGRTFLVANIKITNDYTRSVEINVRDYVRLAVGKLNERLAPDIHNDPVEVQALSTKYTRVGFPVDEKEKTFTLQIGEITGKKELIALKLQ